MSSCFRKLQRFEVHVSGCLVISYVMLLTRCSTCWTLLCTFSLNSASVTQLNELRLEEVAAAERLIILFCGHYRCTQMLNILCSCRYFPQQEADTPQHLYRANSVHGPQKVQVQQQDINSIYKVAQLSRRNWSEHEWKKFQLQPKSHDSSYWTYSDKTKEKGGLEEINMQTEEWSDLWGQIWTEPEHESSKKVHF